MASSSSSHMFTVRRRKAEFITPAKPTSHDIKYLSDIDDQEGLRFYLPNIYFYRNDVSMAAAGRDPVDVIRKALADALVFYYPFAGRLKEGLDRKLIVDCTGEGIMFIEADADVHLEQFGDPLQLPIPCVDELLCYVPAGSKGVLNCPLLLIQVTRLICGGFILTVRLNHTMSDAQGYMQFLTGVAEIARGAPSPSVLPVWHRELLNARNPPQVTFTHPEYDTVPDTRNTLIPRGEMVQRYFFFGPQEMAGLRTHLPLHFRTYTTFELLTACLWRCRIIAINPDPDEQVRLICVVNARRKLHPPLPAGYYGNAIAYPVAITTVEKLCKNPIEYAVELVKKVKNEVNDEYMRSVADRMVIKGRPRHVVVGTYLVSDLTRVGFRNVDFGWGKALYGGPAKGGEGAFPGLASYHIPFKNNRGVDGILVPICLPKHAMEKFVVLIESMLNEPPICCLKPPKTASSL